ncbi:SDR family NAD(P)-dependent oxidoreductase [Acidiferrimicrobium sp. IK]|uniref:SDR family NAD(P)-dependent oxidoreductase n=1 Tax=Acidiferrimicrobium sp. IK TaxID=2871700 RepID=UPI0021CB8AA6|nr:SDR family NAD(P)-dependent oxidoreductase [Acidiferrimicrobium sp. IK]MCU4186024.1 SDR family NAD(P)-dependent oxidoreductase [Acidiferrimicrobium sp. IK]
MNDPIPTPPETPSRGVAVVTGASSGIGAATARHLVAAGFDVVLGARRLDRLEQVAGPLGAKARALPLDVTDQGSVDAFCAEVPEVRVLVNNAGGAKGLDPLSAAVEDDWRWMYETNVLGTMRVTRALLPALLASGNGLVVGIGSIAAFEPYQGGAGYNAAKHASRAVMDVLRLEMIGQPVRVTQIDPGMVRTDFSEVRFGGDRERADAVYRGVTPLSADDIAEIVAFVATRPAHVDIDNVVVRPRDQARSWLVNRKPEGA